MVTGPRSFMTMHADFSVADKNTLHCVVSLLCTVLETPHYSRVTQHPLSPQKSKTNPIQTSVCPGFFFFFFSKIPNLSSKLKSIASEKNEVVIARCHGSKRDTTFHSWIPKREDSARFLGLFSLVGERKTTLFFFYERLPQENWSGSLVSFFFVWFFFFFFIKIWGQFTGCSKKETVTKNHATLSFLETIVAIFPESISYLLDSLVDFLCIYRILSQVDIVRVLHFIRC